MRSSNAFLEGENDPEAVLEQLGHWLSGAVAHCTLGVALGILAARFMRRRHLHWSWATGAPALLLLVKPGLKGMAFTLTLAALFASVRGRRWHREDVEAGADLAELAGSRRTPHDLLRSLGRAMALGLSETMSTSRRVRDQRVVLGVDESHRAVSIPFGAGGSGRHTLVVGATGSGKTVTQTWIAARAIEQGMAAIVVDPKGDADMREQLRRAALDADRRFLAWTPEGNLIYNPYARGGTSEIADQLLAGEHFTEPHYLRQAQRYLAHVVRVLRQSNTEVSLGAIVENLHPARLEVLARQLHEAHARKTFAYLDSLSSRQQSDLAGVRDRLAILAESDVGQWLDPHTIGAEPFDLLAAVRERTVVYFSLESDKRPLLTEMLGAAIVGDLQTVVAACQRKPIPTLAVIDEFSAVAAEQVVRLFGRARSAGFSLLLGTQELSDLRLPGRERLLEQVLGNLSALIAHRQVVPSSAELISRIAGMRGAWKVSRHSDGRTTRVRHREPVLDPGKVMSLERGWAAALVLEHGGSAHITRMFSPKRYR
jgi:Type IV secretion-system coupling protein DNA-binding domain